MSENLIKSTCRELGITYKQLGELIGLSEGRIKQLAISEVGEQVTKSCELLKKVHDLEAKLNKQEQLKALLKDFLE